MTTLIMLALLVPLLCYAGEFWAKKLRFVVKKYRALAEKAGRIRDAIAEEVRR